jgi:hypothetical protein
MLSPLSANVSRHVLDWKHILPFGLSYDFKFDGLGFATLAFNNISGLGRGGTGTFKVDGKVVSAERVGTCR